PYGVPNLRAATADSGRNTIATLGYNSGVSISGVQWFNAAANPPAWTDLAINNVYVDQYDSRRRVFAVAAFNADVPLRFNVPGGTVQIMADAGWSADNDQGSGATLFSRNDVLDSAAGNRLLSMCYYTHDHVWRDGAMGSRPYQLAHLRNSRGRIDDVGGTVESAQDRAVRAKPYDHDIVDHAWPNFGYFESPNSTGGHTYGTWLGHLHNIMVENGVSTAGYSSIIHLYPSDSSAGPDDGGTSGPWSGKQVFIPNSAVVLPSDAGLVLTAHELGHALMGWPDLYDLDFYTNAWGHVPPLDRTNMMGPYSLMARAGGVRVDAFLKTLAGWATPVVVTEDIVRAQIPQVEGTLQDPVIYKLPGRPHYIPTGVPPNQWQEFFLVENRNRNGAEYFGDPSPKGLYIYHVDLRFSQTSEDHPMVIVEQADGLFELERNPEGQYGDLEGDPFPGALGVRNWTQYTNPGSQSHGWKEGTSSPNQIGPMVVEPPTPPAGTLLNGTQTDSFSRVTNISDPGALMFADLHVVPREVIVTAVPIPDQPSQISQGTTDLLVQHLNFNNSGTLPNFSMGDVEIATLRIDETGSSQRDTDIDRVSLFDDTDANGEFDPAVDTRIATTSIQSQSAFFTNLNYRIPLDEQRDLFVTYDISTGANPAQGNSVGAGIARHDYVLPKVPGAVQERARSAITATSPGLGAHRFPIVSSFVGIVEDPDTLTITPISRAPLEPVPAAEGLRVLAIEPGDVDVPILSLNLEVDQDSVTIDQVTVDETGTINAVAHITAARLYIDNNQDGAVDGGDTLLEETNFANVAGVQRAVFNITTNPVQVDEGAMVSLLLTASLSPDLPLEEPPLTLQYTLVDTTYVNLRQYSADPQLHDVVSDENFPMASDVVSTPVPNEPPAPPQNLAASVLTDGSVLLEWDLSPDDPDVGGEADVVHYNIYRSTDPADFATVTPAEVYATVGAGGTQYNDLNAPLATDLYYMARAWDGVQEGPNSNVAGPVRASDEVAPTFSAFDPAEGAENVPLDSNIAFTITDTASGIDRDSLVFEVDGV
ncbi:MAG: hypothetical protein GX131_19000, partial [candidate division WS1 bacterium]|nr:hypothetical protein [candidate division WS1 bacterium]